LALGAVLMGASEDIIAGLLPEMAANFGVSLSQTASGRPGPERRTLVDHHHNQRPRPGRADVPRVLHAEHRPDRLLPGHHEIPHPDQVIPHELRIVLRSQPGADEQVAELRLPSTL
jgi:hypothetical protein